MASKSIQEEMKSLPQRATVPSLNEILTQLHQDPGFRQRYKEYCRAVLDGRFSFSGIKNPIYDHISNHAPPAAMNINSYNMSYQNLNRPVNYN